MTLHIKELLPEVFVKNLWETWTDIGLCVGQAKCFSIFSADLLCPQLRCFHRTLGRIQVLPRVSLPPV